MKAQNKGQKGTVAIEDHEGRIRLRWSFAGKRFSLALELLVGSTGEPARCGG